MAGSVNKVILIARLGGDPEIKANASGGKIVRLRVATSKSWKDRSGDRQEKTTWHTVVIFDERLAETAASYLRKGSNVYLEGALDSREWEAKDGTKRQVTEVVLQNFEGKLTLLDPRPQGEESQSKTVAKRELPGRKAHFVEESPEKDLDDQIPF